MKIALTVFTFFFAWLIVIGQSVPSYYNNVDLTLTGIDLKNELSQKITTTHTTTLTYNQVWNVLKSSDINPFNSSNVLLLYGWNDSDGDVTTDLNRNKNNNGGSNGEWNREHTYPKSLGTPDLGTSGPGADAHNLRACDVQRNGSRGNKKFAAGSGISSGTVGANWYPGDQWKGDVARIIMYMYLRYNSRCKPSSVCVGNPVGVDLNMVQLLLEWNAEDPVDNFEDYRNEIIQQNQGNRNPFIDNPYLATLIWGGTTAENRWNLNTEIEATNQVRIFPNPTLNNTIFIESITSINIELVNVFNTSGQLIKQITPVNNGESLITINNLPEGLHFIQIKSGQTVHTSKIIVN